MSVKAKSDDGKPQKLAISDFLQDADSWANEEDDLPVAPLATFDISSNVSSDDHYQPPPAKGATNSGSASLSRSGRDNGGYVPPPSASARAHPRDRQLVPECPPYRAYVASLPYTVTEKQVQDFFRDVKAVRFLRDKRDHTFRGAAYVEFYQAASLAAALELDGARMQNRSIRVGVADAPRSPSRTPMSAQSERSGPAQWRSETLRSPTSQPANLPHHHTPTSPKGATSDRCPPVRDSPVGRRPSAGKDWASLRRQAGPPQTRSVADAPMNNDPRFGRRRSTSRATHSSVPPVSSDSRVPVSPPRLSGPIGGPIGDPIGNASAPRKKVNPFGDAKARDQNIILQLAEERRQQRCLEKNQSSPASPQTPPATMESVKATTAASIQGEGPTESTLVPEDTAKQLGASRNPRRPSTGKPVSPKVLQVVEAVSVQAVREALIPRVDGPGGAKPGASKERAPNNNAKRAPGDRVDVAKVETAGKISLNGKVEVTKAMERSPEMPTSVAVASKPPTNPRAKRLLASPDRSSHPAGAGAYQSRTFPNSERGNRSRGNGRVPGLHYDSGGADCRRPVNDSCFNHSGQRRSFRSGGQVPDMCADGKARMTHAFQNQPTGEQHHDRLHDGKPRHQRPYLSQVSHPRGNNTNARRPPLVTGDHHGR